MRIGLEYDVIRVTQAQKIEDGQDTEGVGVQGRLFSGVPNV